ncbi:MAG: hypothetical protein HOP23_03090 [Methylococcaceae bacterium]|nr:hypothetical protein [Methylococcaceae bacterium]
MKVIDHARWALALVLPLAATAGHAALSLPTASSTLPGFTAPGIIAPSFPNFLSTNEVVKVQKFGTGANTYWKLTGSGTTAVFDSLNGSTFKSYAVGSDKIKYEANFNSAGKLITSIGSTSLTNYLQINGSLPAGNFGPTSWTAKPNQLLLKANLLDINPTNGTADAIGTFGGFALGFNTQFTGGWATTVPGLTGGSLGESLWLAGLSSGFFNLVKALDGSTSNGTLSSLFNSSKAVTINGVVSVSSVPVPGAVWLFLTGMMTVLGLNRKSSKKIAL